MSELKTKINFTSFQTHYYSTVPVSRIYKNLRSLAGIDDCVQKAGRYFKKFYISEERIQQPKKLQIQKTDITSSVAERHHFNTDQHLSFQFDPDQNFFFDADRNPAPY
jgi:hypothetical protein